MFDKIFDYIKNVYNEMRKVTWPTRNELTGSTVVVIVISALVALIIFVLDRIFTLFLGIIIK
uniref:Protein translocase subunit SecE n=1 Tax=candidate division WOR-3 bacterium TaxID=2052148 RepID=A0A7C4XKJ9_UNCW3